MEELPKAFEPAEIEEKLLSFWRAGKFFEASTEGTKPSFSLSIPPPNVTGVLHMGHAFVNTLQDVLARWKRMLGYEVLWVPGTDHAGIATQAVVERHLMAKEGKRRADMEREAFLDQVWQWKEESERNILSQLERLGSSCDLSRLAFTMDAERSRAVRSVFKKMFEDGLIYRGDRLVHWDPVTKTALSDDEVEYEERLGQLFYIRYPFEESGGYAVVATTRPETLLGDTAVAVSPEDERYRHLVGKYVVLPIMGRKLPIIADRRIDPAFGTGMVKITPAHDFLDYEIGRDHNLEMIQILRDDGHISEAGGPFAGLSREEARIQIVEQLKKLNLLQKEESHPHRVGLSYRSKAVLEPHLSKQWFVQMGPFKERLLAAVREKRVELIPGHWEATYFHWIENLRDWCISRQLWWGHRIPIWYHKEDPSQLLCWAEEGMPPEVAAAPNDWVQDPDVLDTWFSSALWPFAVLGWPEKTADMERFYPNSILVTGHDILFFWVARMLMMGEYATGKLPFPRVFLHGLIYGKTYWRMSHLGAVQYITGQEKGDYDMGKPTPPGVFSKWEKMSKSKGNVIDPIDMIHAYGTDALRTALCASATHARQIDLDRRRFEEFKNFANKVWNGARFVLMNLKDLPPEELASGLNLEILDLEDRWILSVLGGTIEEVSTALESYHFDKAAITTYQFFWDQLCAYYVEMTKPILFGKLGSPEQRRSKQKILSIVLLAAIRLMHPITPFITEELFQILKNGYGSALPNKTQDPYTHEALTALQVSACCVTPFPTIVTKQQRSTSTEEEFEGIRRIVHAVRTIRGEMQIPPSLATDLYLVSQDESSKGMLRTLEEHAQILRALVPTGQLQIEVSPPEGTFCAEGMAEGATLFVPLPHELKERELARLTKEAEKLTSQVNSLSTQLAREDFVTRAPQELVEKQRTQLERAKAELHEITSRLSVLKV